MTAEGKPSTPEVGPEARSRLVLVEDHAILREGLRALLELEPDLEIAGEATNGIDAVALVESLPKEAFQRTTEELPDLIHLNRIPRRKDKVPPITLLQAYGELLTSEPHYARRYVEVLQEAAKTDPNDPTVLSALAWIEVGKNTPESNSKRCGKSGGRPRPRSWGSPARNAT